MEDEAIIALFWARREEAITETAEKYGSYCHSIARNILRDTGDCEECVNDTWLRAWNALPPEHPRIFSAFLGTITRNLSLSRLRSAQALKRRGDQLAVAYEELSQSVPGRENVEETVNARELGRLLDQFLRTLSSRDSCIFVRRYWYLDTTAQIARRFAMPEGSVKSKLHGIRKKLRIFLEQEGYEQ